MTEKKAHGQIRQGQLITTYGPGALIDLPRDSAIIGGLETWPPKKDLDQIIEPRLTDKLRVMTGVPAPELYAPPPARTDPGAPNVGIRVWRFPEWFVVREDSVSAENERSRRLVHRKALDEKGRFDGREVVATRFVRACPKGHIDDLDWWRFVHGADNNCKRQLWLDEHGTSGDLSELSVRCECGARRNLYEAAERETKPLGFCQGRRPWLGKDDNEDCNQPSRLLIRTASNAYFPQVVSVLSLPDHESEVEKIVREHWEYLDFVADATELTFVKKKSVIAEALHGYADNDVLKAINDLKPGKDTDRDIKSVELEAVLGAKEGFGDDVPIDLDFHVRRLPENVWRRSQRVQNIEAVIQLHRLGEVLALIGFSRFEAVMPDINGEYESDVERADLAAEPQWFPAVENRGEGVFIQLRTEAVMEWFERPAVKARLDKLCEGHMAWNKARKTQREFPGGPYILLHTFSHLLIHALSVRCGYPASSIRERVYADYEAERFGVLLYTASPDAEGTLGGLVQEARHVEDHVIDALRTSALCSNDPICAQHTPGRSMERRYLHGAACHGCALVAETSCEMHNDYLDRALVVPVLGERDAAFFEGVQ